MNPCTRKLADWMKSFAILSFRNIGMRLLIGLPVVFCGTLNLLASEPAGGSSPNEQLALKLSQLGSSSRIKLSFLQGIAQPKRDALLKAAAGGLVSRISIGEGARVSTGQSLLTLDDRVEKASVSVAAQAAAAQAGLEQARVQLQVAQSIFERTQSAYQASASSNLELDAKRAELDQARAAYEAEREAIDRAKAELELANANLERLTLDAPFDGEVVALLAQVGSTVLPGDELLRVADLSTLRVEMHLPTELFGMVQSGATLTLHASKPVNRSIQAEVVFSAPVIEATSGTFRTILEIDNRDRSLPSGFEVWLVPPSDMN